MTEFEIKKNVENAFYAYDEMKKRTEAAIAELATNNLGVDYGRLKGGAGHYDDLIADALDRNSEEKQWCKVVELTRSHFATQVEANMILRKYFDGKRRYRRERMLRICRECYISEATFYNILRRVIYYAAMIASQYGLLEIV